MLPQQPFNGSPVASEDSPTPLGWHLILRDLAPHCSSSLLFHTASVISPPSPAHRHVVTMSTGHQAFVLTALLFNSQVFLLPQAGLHLKSLKTFLICIYYLPESVWHYGLSKFLSPVRLWFPEDSGCTLIIFVSSEANPVLLLK